MSERIVKACLHLTTTVVC